MWPKQLLEMSELSDFSDRLSACDLMILKLVNEDRLYCRFFLNGLYLDRMFVTAPALVAELSPLCGEEVNAGGVARLKQALSAA